MLFITRRRVVGFRMDRGKRRWRGRGREAKGESLLFVVLIPPAGFDILKVVN